MRLGISTTVFAELDSAASPSLLQKDWRAMAQRSARYALSRQGYELNVAFDHGSLRKVASKPFIACIGSVMDSADVATAGGDCESAAAHDCGRRAVRRRQSASLSPAMAAQPATQSATVYFDGRIHADAPLPAGRTWRPAIDSRARR